MQPPTFVDEQERLEDEDMPNDKNILLVVGVTENPETGSKSAVVTYYQGQKTELTVEEARTRAEGIIQAIAYVKAEAVLIQDTASKSFSLRLQERALAEARRRIHTLRGLYELPAGIKTGFNVKTLEGAISIVIGAGDFLFTIDVAKHHARCLFEAAESCASDLIFQRFLTSSGMSISETQRILYEFQEIRNNITLELQAS